MLLLGQVAESFSCFGSQCSIRITGEEAAASDTIAEARSQLLEWYDAFSRFEPDSELSRLNRDPREEVAASPTMLRLVDAIRAAHVLSGGLVDGTLIDEIETAGYAGHFGGVGVPLAEALCAAPDRAPAGPRAGGLGGLRTHARTGTVVRPAPLKLDSGGIGKGLFADLITARLSAFECFAVDCGGDMRIGGRAGLAREVHVIDPFDGEPVHTLSVIDGGIATSGIGRRSWLSADGLPMHHLLDPATGRPAFTGLVQVTAIASTAVLAETLSKAALLSGPAAAARWLPLGGVLVHDDGGIEVVDAR